MRNSAPRSGAARCSCARTSGAIEPEIIANAGDQYFPELFRAPRRVFDSNETGTLVPRSRHRRSVTRPTPASTESDCQSSFGNITNANGLYTTTGNNQFTCFNNPYTTYEQDKLYGMTTVVHPAVGR